MSNFHYNFPKRCFPQYLLITKKRKLWMYSSENKNVQTNDIIVTKMLSKQRIINFEPSGKGFLNNPLNFKKSL